MEGYWPLPQTCELFARGAVVADASARTRTAAVP